MKLLGRIAKAFAELPFALVPFISLIAAHFFGQILAHHAAEFGNQRLRFFFGGVCAGENRARLRAFVAQDAGEAASVDIGNSHGLVAHQIFLQAFARAEIAVQKRQVADNQAGGKHAAALFIFAVGAGVADMRIGEGNDLLGIRGVGENFLIAAHRSVEHHLARSGAVMADRSAVKHAAVCQHKNGARCHDDFLLPDVCRWYAWGVLKQAV